MYSGEYDDGNDGHDEKAKVGDKDDDDHNDYNNDVYISDNDNNANASEVPVAPSITLISEKEVRVGYGRVRS